MGRLDLPDPRRDEDDYVRIHHSYFVDLRAAAELAPALELEIDRLTHETEELEDRVATLLHELAMARMKRAKMPPVVLRRKRAA